MSKFDPATITTEKSFRAIWKNARRIPRSRFNRSCMIAMTFTTSVYLIASKQSPHEIAEMVRSWVNVGLGFAGAILGFLIAGFTIFATLSKPSLMAALARQNEPTSGLSYLKYSFAIFFETFGWYVFFAGLCVLVLVFGSLNGAASQLVLLLSGKSRIVAEWIIPRIVALVVAAWLVLLCLELKSFLFNIYNVIMISIRWTLEYPEKEESACQYVPSAGSQVPQTSSTSTPVK